jgi:hypothetical protein
MNWPALITRALLIVAFGIAVLFLLDLVRGW